MVCRVMVHEEKFLTEGCQETSTGLTSINKITRNKFVDIAMKVFLWKNKQRYSLQKSEKSNGVLTKDNC
jgi:hypothetical protein